MTRFFRNIARIIKKPVKAIMKPAINVGKAIAKPIKNALPSVKDALKGTPEVRENVSLLRPEQEQIYQQVMNAISGGGTSQIPGNANTPLSNNIPNAQAATNPAQSVMNYYSGLLNNGSPLGSNIPQVGNNPMNPITQQEIEAQRGISPEDRQGGFDENALIDPLVREYKEQHVPGLAEQFAGFGAGGLNSSGFRNAQIQGEVDLKERIERIRAELRHRGVEGMQQMLGMGLQNYSQNMTTQPGTPGLLSQVAPAVGTAAGAYLGGPMGAAAGSALGGAVGNSMSGSNVGRNTSPYGGTNYAASPTTSGGGLKMPNFLQGTGVRGY